MGAGVRAAPVAQQQQRVGLGVIELQVLDPHAAQVVTDELGGVAAGAQGHVALVGVDVVDAVRHDSAVREAGKVVVVDPAGTRRVALARPVEVAQHLLLLGVDAQHGQVLIGEGRTVAADFLELLVALLNLFHIVHFQQLAFLIAAHTKHLGDVVAADLQAFAGQQGHDLTAVEVGPLHPVVLRKARRAV